MTADAVATQSAAATNGQTGTLRRVVAGVLVALSCLAFSAYVVVHWAERQVLNTDNWVALVGPLPKQPVVSTALGSYIGQQVFDGPAVQQKITAALPERAGFLAGPLTNQLDGLTTKAAQRVVASDGFQTIWTGANRIAMDRLLATARGQTPPLQSRINEKFNINLSASEGQIAAALGKASTAIPALQPASQKLVSVSTDLRARPHRLQQIVQTIDRLAVVLPLLVAATLLSALALIRGRRRTLMAAMITVFVLMLVELIAIKWGRQTVLSQVQNPSNTPAISYMFDTLIALMKHMIYVVIGITVGVYAALLASGPARWAVAARSWVHLDKIQTSRPIAYWHTARLWARRWQPYIWLGTILAVLLGLALRGSVDGKVIINGILLAISLVALERIIASPPYAASLPESKGSRYGPLTTSRPSRA